MDLPTDSIAGPVYPYDTQAVPTLPTLHCTARIHLLVVSFIRVPAQSSCPEPLSSQLGSTLLLQLLVEVVAGVSPRHVVAVPKSR
jgi:hypothetical protein